jgi:hypothetical protein
MEERDVRTRGDMVLLGSTTCCCRTAGEDWGVDREDVKFRPSLNLTLRFNCSKERAQGI